MDFFKSFKVEKPAFQSLKEGTHVVRVARFAETHSFNKYDGSQKDDLPEWSNPTPQLAITVVAVEGGGGLTHRLNGCGFVQFDDLSEEQLQSGKFVALGKTGYACYEDEEGDTVRLIDEEKTQACANIINQFAAALGLSEDSNLIEGLEKAISEKLTMKVTVVNDPYDGKDQLRIAKFESAASVVADTGFDD